MRGCGRCRRSCTRTSCSTRCTPSRPWCTRNPDLADRMISRLSDLLRLTFDRSGASRVPLQEELEFLAEVSRHRTDALPGSPDGSVRNRSRHARRRGAAADPAAAGRERDQARHRAAERSRVRPDRRRDASPATSGSRFATTASGLTPGARARFAAASACRIRAAASSACTATATDSSSPEAGGPLGAHRDPLSHAAAADDAVRVA